jgi:hypothetical protein
MFVARNGLVVPVQPAGRGVYGNDGIGINGISPVAQLKIPVEIWVGVGDRAKHLAGLGIERVSCPESATEVESQCGFKVPQLLLPVLASKAIRRPAMPESPTEMPINTFPCQAIGAELKASCLVGLPRPARPIAPGRSWHRADHPAIPCAAEDLPIQIARLLLFAGTCLQSIT